MAPIARIDHRVVGSGVPASGDQETTGAWASPGRIAGTDVSRTGVSIARIPRAGGTEDANGVALARCDGRHDVVLPVGDCRHGSRSP